MRVANMVSNGAQIGLTMYHLEREARERTSHETVRPDVQTESGILLQACFARREHARSCSMLRAFLTLAKDSNRRGR